MKQQHHARHPASTTTPERLLLIKKAAQQSMSYTTVLTGVLCGINCYTPSTLKLAGGWWELCACQTNQPPPFRRLIPLSAQGHWQERDLVVKDKGTTGLTITQIQLLCQLGSEWNAVNHNQPNRLLR